MTDQTEYIPIETWGKDHWSTLAYVETVMVECAGFQIGLDPRMRTNRRHYRVLSERCRSPKRPGGGARSSHSLAVVMRPEHGSRLKDGEVMEGHDDWMCLQDMAEAGFFTVGAGRIEPAVVLKLSERGRQVVDALRQFKSEGGKYAAFVAPTV